jgi:hypothetical protein
MSYELSVVVNTYNRLPEVFEADLKLVSFGRDNALKVLFEIIRNHKLENHVGIRLLHKHNLIFENEIMVEGAISDSEGFALVTQALPISDVDGRVVPNSWVLTDSAFIPMEFSHKNLVFNSKICPETKPEFFAELATKLRELGLSTVLGPALISSDFVKSNSPGSSTLMIERSALDDRVNILRYARSNDFSKDSFVETYWCINSESDCQTENERQSQNEPKPMVVCQRICPSVQNPPVHQGTYVHRRS